jgi:hypothetical protein
MKMKTKTVLLAVAMVAVCGAALPTCSQLPPLPIPVADNAPAPTAMVQLPG